MPDSCQHCGRMFDPGEPAVLADDQTRILCRPCSELSRPIIIRPQLAFYGVTNQHADRKRAELTRSLGRIPNGLEVIHALYDDANPTDEIRRASSYLSLAVDYHFAGRDPTPIKRVALRAGLTRLVGTIKHVMVANGGNACPECRKLDGLAMPIEQAIAEMPVPCLRCETTRGEEILEPTGYVPLPFGWCRCLYVPTRLK